MTDEINIANIFTASKMRRFECQENEGFVEKRYLFTP